MKSAARTALLGVALVVLCGALGFLAARLGAPPAGARVSLERLPPPPLPELQSPPAERKIPEQLPRLTLPDPEGRPHPLAEFHGRPLLVNFWAPWCDPCRREIPLLEQLRRQNAGSGLEVVGIALDNAERVRDYVSQKNIPYPVRIAEAQAFEAASAFGMEAVLPFTVFATGAGDILTLKVGELRPAEAHALVRALIAVQQGRQTLPAARAMLRDELPQINAQAAKTAPDSR